MLSTPSPLRASISLVLDVVRRIPSSLKSHGLRATAVRTLRPLRLTASAHQVAELAAIRAFRDHVVPRADGDHYFYATSNYLFSDARATEQLSMALDHHRAEQNDFVAGFVDAVYGDGITLWTHDADGTDASGAGKREHFELRLGRARHHLGEGPLTLTLYVDGQDVRLMSLSFIDPTAVDDSIGRDPDSTTSAERTVLIARHQYWRTDLAQNDGDTMLHHAHDADRNVGSSLFASNSPMNLCLAGAAGIALACGASAMYGIDEHQTLVADKAESTMQSNYSDCWSKFNATRSSQRAWRIPLPLDSTPIEQVSSKKRRRARARRRLLDSIELSCFERLNEFRRVPLVTPEFPNREHDRNAIDPAGS